MPATMHNGMRRREIMGAAAAGLAGAGMTGPTGAPAGGGGGGPGRPGAGAGGREPLRLDRLRLISLSHVNDPATTNVYPGDPPFELDTIATIPDNGYFLQFVKEGEHTGTH